MGFFEEKLYEQILNAAHSLIVGLDNQFQIQIFNRFSETTLGYSKEEVRGKVWCNLFIPDAHRAQNRKVLEELRTSGSPSHHEGVVRTKEGRELIVEWANTVFRDIRGEVTLILGIGNDVTERRQTAEALRESEERFRLIFENAGDAIFIADIQTGEILQVNREAEKLTGRTRHELIGLHQSKLHPAEEEERYRTMFQNHIQKGSGFTSHAEVCRKDGIRIPVEIRAGVGELGERKIIIGSFRDISARHPVSQTGQGKKKNR